jgi:hypothetical protein
VIVGVWWWVRRGKATGPRRALAPVAGTQDAAITETIIEDEGPPLAVPTGSTDIPDGGFWLELEDETYVTLWLHHEDSVRKVAYLRGVEHSGEYADFGVVEDGQVLIAPAFSDILALGVAVQLLFGGDHVEAHERFLRDCAEYAATSGTCGRCGHAISSVKSVWRGLGPECFAKAGTWRLC